MFEYSYFLTSTSHMLTVYVMSEGAPLKLSYSSPQIKPSLIYFLSIVMVCLSGSQYSTNGCNVSPPLYQCFLTDNAYFTSFNNRLWWQFKKEEVQFLPRSWYLLAGGLPSFSAKNLQMSLLRFCPPYAATFADFNRQKPQWTATDRVKFQPESRTSAVDLPVAKQERTGALRQNTLATPSLQNRNCAVFYLNSLFQAALAAMSQLSSIEQSLRSTASQLIR